MKTSLVLLVMGVSGSGKSIVGLRLARALGWRFLEGDDFHPLANVAKMAAGIPLGDGDRAPFLAAIREKIVACLERGENAVVTCSALKESYRRILVVDPVRVKLVHLTGDPSLIRDRLARRRGHFMKADLLASQFAALEPPGDALALDVAATPDELVAAIRTALAV